MMMAPPTRQIFSLHRADTISTGLIQVERICLAPLLAGGPSGYSRGLRTFNEHTRAAHSRIALRRFDTGFGHSCKV
jgi:hypothetical protein